MGPWWFAQFDSVSEVAQAAKRSLQVGQHCLLGLHFIVIVCECVLMVGLSVCHSSSSYLFFKDLAMMNPSELEIEIYSIVTSLGNILVC